MHSLDYRTGLVLPCYSPEPGIGSPPDCGFKEPPLATLRKKIAGIFITLEGGEGSGKTTQAVRLCRLLTTQGHEILHTREPGGTPVAEQLRSVLLDNSTEAIAPETETLLILAARRQHVDHVIRPALKRGIVVICDRFSDSTMAYQGYARGLDLKLLRAMNDWATGNLAPHLTLLFDVPVAIGLRRRQDQATTQNRLDRETERFHRKVRAGFLQLARREPRRIKVVDARQSPDSVSNTVATLVLEGLRAGRSRNRGRR
ncbi:MAG: dTMP kinase [Nitrospirae bacterium]|nr:dTMP kinase [Nitrospirota bacterium]